MRTLFALMLLLALAGLAAAEEFVIEVPMAAVTEVTYDGSTVQRFQVSLPEGLDGSTLLKASLRVMAGSGVDSEDDFVEVQVAEWRAGEPVIPAQKARPVSLGFEATRPATIQLDIRPILADWSGGEPLDLVLGKLSEDCWGDPQITALDAGAGVLCVLNLVTE